MDAHTPREIPPDLERRIEAALLRIPFPRRPDNLRPALEAAYGVFATHLSDAGWALTDDLLVLHIPALVFEFAREQGWPLPTTRTRAVRQVWRWGEPRPAPAVEPIPEAEQRTLVRRLVADKIHWWQAEALSPSKPTAEATARAFAMAQAAAEAAIAVAKKLASKPRGRPRALEIDGAAVKVMRAKLGLTQPELAGSAGIPEDKLQRAEGGKATAETAKKLRKFAKLRGYPLFPEDAENATKKPPA